MTSTTQAEHFEESGPTSGIRTIRHERAILLVAPQDATLFAMSKGLAQRGFAICVESSFDAAVEFFLRAPGAFSAIVTEFDSSSADFAARVRAADPIIGIVLWSGTHRIPPVPGVDALVSASSAAALADALTVLLDAP